MPTRPAAQLGRPPVQQVAVRRTLCRRILAGEWQPGERLPPRTALIRQLKTTSATLQSALDDLIADGLVVTRGVHGTFIHEHAPHRFRYGLLLPQDPGNDPSHRFWHALAAVTKRPMTVGEGRTLVLYYGRHLHAASPSYDRLIDDLHHHRLAGLVIVAPPSMFADTPILTACIPRGFLAAGPLPAQALRIEVDWQSFRHLATERLVARGCRRVAVLAGAGRLSEPNEIPAWLEAFAAAGLISHETWFVAADLLFPAPIAAHLRLVLEAKERPDGLLVADDNLLPTVLGALHRFGLTPGRDIQVLAHANFPLPANEPTKVERLGFDARQLIVSVLDTFDSIHRGQPPASSTVRIPAVLRQDL